VKTSNLTNTEKKKKKLLTGIWRRVALVRRTNVLEEHSPLFSVFLRIMLRLLVTGNFVPSSSIIDTLILMETMPPSETAVLTRATRRHISEDGTVHLYLYFLISEHILSAQKRCYLIVGKSNRGRPVTMGMEAKCWGVTALGVLLFIRTGHRILRGAQ
jgi:hypothetical protein